MPSVEPPSQPSATPFTQPSPPASSSSADLLTDVQPSDVEFLDVLKTGGRGPTIFKVKIGDRLCIMKVSQFRGQHDSSTFDVDEEVRLFLRESRAYRLLKDKGFCERGVIPNFYGTIERIDVGLWPDLCDFKGDLLPPDAVLLEYIPNVERCGIENFSEDNLSRFSLVLREFHELGLLHGDPYPRNMLVARQQPRDRVVWIDFDCAQIVRPGYCKDYGENDFDEEQRLVDEFGVLLAKDAKTGKIDKTWLYYYA
ncbi:hypothetical protein LLEC1_03329 [Akanthomyces lecanii]|uniref:Protein kinase domain-containing protein n=1 Tax=Cordyceps confragosa TaxID=2714763 RepID=A0A179IJ57_CORDF|nr:hypothetical protein LLEC1_03329 [Akanthomyces lecanii]